jgi:diaminopimelate decarboxylase
MDGSTDITMRRLGRDQMAQAATPCFIFDPAVVISTYSRLRAALATPLIVSLKANPSIDLFVRCAHAFTDGVELASQGELDLVIGRTAAPKFVNTPGMDLALMKAALASRATLVLDNLDQVDMLTSLDVRAATPLRVALRVNAASVAEAAIGRAHLDHFGMDVEALLLAADRLTRAAVEVRGLHVFAGSYTFESCSSALADNADALITHVEQHLPKPIEFINLGGGIADDWDESSPKFADYRRRIARLQVRLTVMHESGRALFSRGGTFATRVLAVKKLDRRHIVVCDGGLAHCFMLAQTEKVLKRLRQPVLLQEGEGSRLATDAPISFVGNSCNRADVIGEMRGGMLPRIGDVVLFDGCGAYHTYSPTNFLSLKPAQCYLVS